MKTRLALALFVVAVAVAGCRTTPIHNPTNVPLPVPAKATQADVGNAIRRAAAHLGWVVQDTKPGEFFAALDVRQHHAEIVITYTATSYSIRYLNSANLHAEAGTIHRRYNSWIENLETHIREEVARIGS